MKQEQKLIPIEIPLEVILTGGHYPVEHNNQSYQIPIEKGTLEHSLIKFDNGITFQIKYQNSSEFFSRQGNDLIAVFVYEKKYEGSKVDIPYLIKDQSIKFVLQEGQFQQEGMGFYNPETHETGNYIFGIQFQENYE